ncbi:SAGA-associated factor 11 homolog [Phlebotomus papatasi]|uniref:SAGA-associated factor 11 homolog n=1 Tax=Phlebotomus papatasi TaxID=29031 RepID=A0A1B0GPW0_PHLPP|nr:SAGA-associated factor 11 homolog [Phlebotomus papatasi]
MSFEFHEYPNESELISEFRKYMLAADNVEKETICNYLFNSLVEDAILGVVLEVHCDARTGISAAIEGQPEDTKPFALIDLPDIDVFGAANAKKAIDCTCPNCDRSVAASRFAPHLEKCMGMGRNSSRIASRRIASTRGTSELFGTVSDDEDDADWSGEKRKKKFQPVRTNGTKKNGKTS